MNRFCVSLSVLALLTATQVISKTEHTRSAHVRTDKSALETQTIEVDQLAEFKAPLLEPGSKEAEAHVMELNHQLISSAQDTGMAQLKGMPKTEIITDSGKTVDLFDVITPENYYDVDAERIKKQKYESTLKYQRGEVTIEQAQNEMFRSFFPVKTNMKPQVMPFKQMKLKNKDFATAIIQPIAIIGVDSYSIDWFKLNLDQIRRMRAVVLITQIDNADQFMALKKFAPDIEYQPVNAEQVVSAMGVNFYPVLITKKGIFQ